jgi:hypothetical protein
MTGYDGESSYCRWDVLEMADVLLENKLTLIRLGDPGQGVFCMEPVDMGGKWDWNFIANDNPYTNGFLHRFYWAPVLAQTSWATEVERIGEPGDGAVKVTLPDGRVDWYRSSAAPCAVEVGGVSFPNALAALVRLDSQGQVMAKEAVKQ